MKNVTISNKTEIKVQYNKNKKTLYYSKVTTYYICNTIDYSKLGK